MKLDIRSRLKKATGQSVVIEHMEPRRLLAAVKIMPLGDSITESFPGHASYRFFLYNQLVQAGYDVDFVGSLTGVNGGSPLYSNFDQNHEGHSGIRTDQIQANIVAWANAAKPDIVLLHTGSNDIEQGQSNSSTANEISGLIDNLRSVVPNVKILLAQIIPENFNTSQYPLLNSLIANVASQKNTAQSPVVLVDQYTGFNNAADTFDGIHPDDSGERKLANKWFDALKTVLPAPTPPNAVYLSDLNATSMINGWGPIEKDRSNNETGATDGNTMALNGIGYLKGLGGHATSDTTYNISGGNYSEFDADVGVDDESGNNGSIIFQVYVNGALQYTSPRMTGSSTTQSIKVPLASNASTLRLVINDAGDSNAYDHGDWAKARLITGVAVAAPNAPSGLQASFNSGTGKIDLTWIDNAGDETGFRIERKTGAGGTYAQIADIASANVQSYSDGASLASGTTYYYRVTAYKTGATSSPSTEAFATVPVAPGTTYLSDLPFQMIANGWGDAERDRSNGETGPSDGGTIRLNGTSYTKGIGVHAASQLVFTLNGQYTQFLSDIGVDDESGANGSVNFQVFLDNAATPIYDSGRMTGSTATNQVIVNVAGATSMRLVVTDSGDGNAYDHADWANARLIAGQSVPAPTAPDTLNATFNSTTNKIDLTWNDSANDNTGFRIERKAGANGTYAQIADLPAGTLSYSDGASLATGTTYFYRAYAYKTGAPNSGYSNESSAAVPVPAGLTYLSDLQFTTIANGWGPVERDRSNGETGATDGRTITLNGVTYAKGLGVHAASNILFQLNGQYSKFFADVGIDDEVNSGSVVFQVFADDVMVFQSGTMRATTVTQTINGLNIAGVQQLRLVVTNNGDGADYDHADWAGARIAT